MGSGARVGWVDSLKGILILLVVVAHFLVKVEDHYAIETIYRLIYMFHMPLFVFVSGLLAKHTLDDRGRLRVGRVLTYPFWGLVFNVTLVVMGTPEESLTTFLTFQSSSWYLLSLGMWLACVPVLDALRPAWGVALAAGLSLVVSVQPEQTDFLALSRTAHFLPYFALGYYLRIADLERVRKGPARAVAIVCAAAAAVGYAVFRPVFDPVYFFATGNNACVLELGSAVVGYVVMAALAVVFSLGCVAAAPARCGLLEYLGVRTLQIYVVHRYIRGAFSVLGFYDAVAWMGSFELLAVLAGISVVVTAFSCLPVFKWCSDRALSIKWGPLLGEGSRQG